MRRGFTICLLAVGFTMLQARIGEAQIHEVIRKNSASKNPRGRISEVTKDGITISVVGKTQKIDANLIVDIKWANAPLKLWLSRSNEVGGRLKQALEGYLESAKDTKASKDPIKSDLEFLIARTIAKMSLADPSKRDDAIKKLETFIKLNPDSFRHYEASRILGDVYLSKKDFANAKKSFDRLLRAPWQDFKMAAKTSHARVMLAEDNVAGALAAYNEVIGSKADGDAEQARKYEAMIGRASCLIKQEKHADAIKTLEQVINQVSSDETRVQAEAYIRQGDCYQALGRIKLALIAYLHVPVLFSKEKSLHAESLYHLSKLWGLVDNPTRGAQARDELQTKYPDSEWAKKLSASG